MGPRTGECPALDCCRHARLHHTGDGEGSGDEASRCRSWSASDHAPIYARGPARFHSRLTVAPTDRESRLDQRADGRRAGFAALAAVLALALIGCGGGAPAATPPESTAPGTYEPAATQTLPPTLAASQTLNIGTPGTDFTPGVVVIPLSELLDPKEWPKTVTNGQLEDAIGAVDVQNLDRATKNNLAKRIAICEKGVGNSMVSSERAGMCEGLAIGMLQAWNHGDQNARVAFELLYAYLVAPGYGFYQDFKNGADFHFVDACRSYGIPTS